MVRTPGAGETLRKCLTAGQGGLPGGGDMAVRLSSGRRNGCGASRNESVREVRVEGEGRGEGVDEQEGLAPGRSGITGAVEGFVTRSRAASERPLAACGGFVDQSGGRGRSWAKEVWADLGVD